MAKTASVTLGGTTYTVKAFTLDDLEEIGTILASGSIDGSTSIKILKIALRNADPPLTGAAGKIHVDSMDELRTATRKVLTLAGLEVKENPTEAAPGTEAAAA